MQGNTFVSVRLENIEKRFSEIDTLLNLAKQNKEDSQIYSALCRSAHVLLVSHFEGIYKDIVKDDLNSNIDFINISKSIFRTHSLHFMHNDARDSNIEHIKDKLWDAFKEYKCNLKHEPFLRTDNKNPTQKIIDDILNKFGEKDFFYSLSNSKLEIVFENNFKMSQRELYRIKRYTQAGTKNFPYTLDTTYYKAINNSLNKEPRKKIKKGLFEEFLEEFLKDRHAIVHGSRLDNPKNSKEIASSKIKIEILIYAFIICICSGASPIYLLKTDQD
ncbi:MAG TPA: HEPN domain-containing protein [Flavobacterium sp.]|nr:HEPN domain-containing protein [Flavobacterium sp.]